MSRIKARMEDPNGNWITCYIDDTEYISKHLQVKEIANPSNNTSIKLELSQASWKHNEAWEYVRTKYNKPITITCGWREKNWNKKRGGTATSLHLTCSAYDCKFSNMSDSLYNQIKSYCLEAANKFNLQVELGRYSWGLHIGFSEKLPYKISGKIYEFDKR